MRGSDYLRLCALAALWGASFLFMRIASPAFGAINTAFFRVALGFGGLLFTLALLKRSLNFAGKFGPSLILGIINSGVPFLMYCLAAKWLPASYSAILNATTPLMGALFGITLFREAVSAKKLSGTALGLCGIIAITAVGELPSARGTAAGVTCCLTATACYALAGFLTRMWITRRGGLDATLVALGSQMGASLFLLPFFIYGIASGPAIDWLQPVAWASVIALGTACTALAYILYFRLIADIGPLRSLMVTFLIPPFALLWGYLALGETAGASSLASAAAIGIGVWMVVSPGKSER